MSKKVKVRITASQRVYFNQVVDMDEDEYEKLNAIYDERRLGELIGNWIDPTDIHDAEYPEDIDIEKLTQETSEETT